VLAGSLSTREALTVMCLLAAMAPVVVMSSRLRTVTRLEELDDVPLSA